MKMSDGELGTCFELHLSVLLPAMLNEFLLGHWKLIVAASFDDRALKVIQGKFSPAVSICYDVRCKLFAVVVSFNVYF